jgi:hypothetical protein
VFDRIAELHPAGFCRTNPAADPDAIVITGRPAITNRDLAYSQTEPGCFELAIAHAALAQVLGSGHVQPHQIAGVVDDPHLIGLRVVDPNQSLRHMPGLGGHACLTGL